MSDKETLSLLTIIDAIDKINTYIAGIDNSDDFYNDVKCFDAVAMNFIVIGEMVMKVSEKFKDSHSEIEWNKIKAFRNLIAHDYFGLNGEEVWQIIHKYLPVFREELVAIVGEP